MLKIVGYADRLSVSPGETVRFMVSCAGGRRYRAEGNREEAELAVFGLRWTEHTART